MKTSTLVKKFKAHFSKGDNESLDFRKHVYVENQHGLSPAVNYSFGERVVTELYSFAHNFIEENEVNFPDFKGWEFNTSMEVEKLRMSTIKSLVESVCDKLANNYHAIEIVSAKFEMVNTCGFGDDCLVSIDAKINGKSESASFTVQLSADGYHESQNGSLVFGTDGSEEFTAIEQMIYDSFDVEDAAESYAQKKISERYVFHDTNFHCALNSREIEIRQDKETDTFQFVIKNIQHNPHWDYGTGIEVLDPIYDSLEDAMEYLEQFRTDDYSDAHGLKAAIEDLESWSY